MAGKDRKGGVEVYRCLLMFGICLMHFAGQYGRGAWWLSGLLPWCVNGFVLITGYFGCRFAVSKILRLYGIVLASALIACQYPMWFGDMPFSFRTILVEAKNLFLWNWFLHAYVVLMCFAPLLDVALERLGTDRRRVLTAVVPLLLVAFGWSHLATFSATAAFVPRTPGLGICTCFTLLGSYVVGRLYRLLEMEKMLSARVSWIGSAVLTVVSLSGIAHMSSFIAVGMAVLTFNLFINWRPHRSVERLASLMGPSMFAVLALHLTPWMQRHSACFVNQFAGWCGSTLLALFLFTAFAYFACVVMDVPRRLLARAFERPIGYALAKVDGWYDKVVSGMVAKL